jgi:hypothetical protein
MISAIVRAWTALAFFLAIISYSSICFVEESLGGSTREYNHQEEFSFLVQTPLFGDIDKICEEDRACERL